MHTIVGLLQIVVLAAGPAEPQESQDVGDRHTAPVRLHVSLVQSEIVRNEPAILTVTLANMSGTDQTVTPALEPEAEYLTCEIVLPDRKRVRYRPMLHVDVTSGTQVLKPGERLVHRQMLIFSVGQGVLFKDAGQYKISANFSITATGRPRRVLKSNVATLTVRPAVGVDAKAIEFFRGNPQACFAVGSTTDWAIGREFETIIKDYPESTYVPWCHYFLGRAWQQREVSQPEAKAEHASRHFESLLNKHQRFPLIVETRYQLAKETLRLGRRDEALKQIEDLVEAHPHWRFFQRVKLQLHVYQDNVRKIQADWLP